MKLFAGMYKIPDMFPTSLSFPGGYRIAGIADKVVWVELTTSPRKEHFYRGVIKDDAPVCVYLEEGNYLKVDGEVEIVPYDPEGN